MDTIEKEIEARINEQIAEETRRRKIERIENAALTILPGVYASAATDGHKDQTIIDIAFAMAEHFIAEADKRASAS